MSRTFSVKRVVRAQCEGPTSVRFEMKGPPDSRHGRLADACALCHLARAPVRGPFRLGLERPPDDFLDALIAQLAVHVGSRRFRQAVDAKLDEPPAPLGDRVRRDPQLGSDILILGAFGASQDDPRAQCQTLRHRSATRIALERRALVARQNQFRQRSPAPTLPSRVCRLHGRETKPRPMDSIFVAVHGLRTLVVCEGAARHRSAIARGLGATNRAARIVHVVGVLVTFIHGTVAAQVILVSSARCPKSLRDRGRSPTPPPHLHRYARLPSHPASARSRRWRIVATTPGDYGDVQLYSALALSPSVPAPKRIRSQSA